MSDELPTASRIPDPGLRALYKLENRWQAWLDVEVALARAQAELGIIPAEAVEPIARAARLELLDRKRIDEAFARTAHTIVPLVWELSRRGRRAARRLGALGRDHAEHHADRRPAGAAAGAPHLSRADTRDPGGDGRPRRARRGHADRRPHARPARGAGHVRLQGRRVDRRAAAPRRALPAGGAAPLRGHAGRRGRHLRLARRAGSRGAGRDGPAPRHGRRCAFPRASSATTWPRTSACSVSSPPPAARSAAKSTRS